MLKLPNKKPEIKVGQKVKLLKLTLDEANELDKMAKDAGWGNLVVAVPGMEQLFGKEVTIKAVYSFGFSIIEDTYFLNWNPVWIDQGNSTPSLKINGTGRCLICG